MLVIAWSWNNIVNVLPIELSLVWWRVRISERNWSNYNKLMSAPSTSIMITNSMILFKKNIKEKNKN